MLERYFVKPDTIEQIRASWLGEPIERYVTWLTEQHYTSRSILRRVPLLRQFGEFAQNHGAKSWEELPAYVDVFVEHWVHQHGQRSTTRRAHNHVINDVQNPIKQMLRLMLPTYVGPGGRQKWPDPFVAQVPGFFAYLRTQRGLREASLRHYEHYLRRFEYYLQQQRLDDLQQLSPVLLSAFVTESRQTLQASAMGSLCSCVRVFVRYLFQQKITARDLSVTLEEPHSYRLTALPRAISWADVTRMLESVDRRTPVGKRDYAILLLLVTYGLRAREIAALTLDMIDWKHARLRVPERKAGHSTAYPLSSVVGAAIIEYLQQGRPTTTDRHLFFRVLAPQVPLTYVAISGRASHYLHKAGVTVARPGSHTLRHTCVQRLVDEGFSLKAIGDYVGHRSPASTEIYAKVAVADLREVALGDGEEAL